VLKKPVVERDTVRLSNWRANIKRLHGIESEKKKLVDVFVVESNMNVLEGNSILLGKGGEIL